MEINPKTYRRIQLLLEQYDTDRKGLSENLKQYHELLDTLSFLHETLAELKVKMPYWQVYSDTLMTKFILHSHSFYNILKGSDFQSNHLTSDTYNRKIIDIPSSKVILRAQIEAFLMYHHVYINPINDNEKELRFNAWIYSSLLQRQSFPEKSKFAKEQKANDKKQIELMRHEISNLPAFKKLSLKQQKGLLEKGSDKLFRNWNTIITETGFEEDHHLSSFYSILSNYAHSEGLSIIQLKESRLGYSNYNREASLLLNQSSQFICIMILSIKDLYKIINIKYNSLPQKTQDLIELYAMLGKGKYKD